MKDIANVRVEVHYIGAGKPFGGEFDRTTRIGDVKTASLSHFGLSEGPSGGGAVVYVLYLDKSPIENMSETVGGLAGDKSILQLKLSQQLTQGRSA